MKLKFMSMAALAACVAFTSCSNDDEPGVQKGNQALSYVSVGINHLANSRAGITATGFSGSESIGLFLFGGEGIDDATDAKRYNIGTNAKLKEPINVKYSRGTEGTVGEDSWNEYFVSTDPIILSEKKGKLYSYYPFAEGEANKDAKAIPVNVAATQGSGISAGSADDNTQADYMYGTVIPNVSNQTTKADIVMNHALSMITFKFERDSYPGTGEITKIKLSNKTSGEYLKNGAATMHIGTGAITGGTAGDVYCTPNAILTDVSASDQIPHMLVYPNATVMSEGDVVLEIEMDGKTYRIDLPHTLSSDSEPYAWLPGKNYVYTLKMKGYGFGADDADGRKNIDVTITQWDDQVVSAGDLTKPVN